MVGGDEHRGAGLLPRVGASPAGEPCCACAVAAARRRRRPRRGYSRSMLAGNLGGAARLAARGALLLSVRGGCRAPGPDAAASAGGWGPPPPSVCGCPVHIGPLGVQTPLRHPRSDQHLCPENVRTFPTAQFYPGDVTKMHLMNGDFFPQMIIILMSV